MEVGTMSLAEQLERLRGARAIVLALSEDALPVARQVGGLLGAEIDVLAVRELRAARGTGKVVGAIAEGTGTAFDEGALAELGLYPDDLLDAVRSAREGLTRDVGRHRDLRRLRDLRGRTVIVAATPGASDVTILAAIAALRRRCERIVVAVAASDRETELDRLREHADEVIALESLGVSTEAQAPAS